jgi:hypothetical protein
LPSLDLTFFTGEEIINDLYNEYGIAWYVIKMSVRSGKGVESTDLWDGERVGRDWLWYSRAR